MTCLGVDMDFAPHHNKPVAGEHVTRHKIGGDAGHRYRDR